MKYQLYKLENEKPQYIFEKHNGIYSLCKTKASSFTYEKALKIQNKYHDLIICDETSDYFKFQTETRYDKWSKEIAEDDTLSFSKTEALQAAIDLCYKDETLEQIVNATTEAQIYRAMRNARAIA